MLVHGSHFSGGWPGGICKNDGIFSHRFWKTKCWSCACHSQLHNSTQSTMPQSTAQLQRLVKPSLVFSCIDKNGHLQWCKNNGKNRHLQWWKNNGKNIYCDFCKIMDSTPGSTLEKTVWQLSITLHSEWKNDQWNLQERWRFFPQIWKTQMLKLCVPWSTAQLQWLVQPSLMHICIDKNSDARTMARTFTVISAK